MVGRQLESEEEVREVIFGEYGNQHDLRLVQVTLVIIPTELILQTETLPTHVAIKTIMLVQIQI
jgi:hypothetical protein